MTFSPASLHETQDPQIPAGTAEVVDRGTTRGLDTTRCDGAVVVPSFPLTD